MEEELIYEAGSRGGTQELTHNTSSELPVTGESYSSTNNEGPVLIGCVS